PDRVEVVDGIAADGQAGARDLREEPSGLGGQPPRGRGADLDVAAEARVACEPRQQRACLRAVADRVVAVRGVEEIDVVPGWRESRIDDLAHLAEAGRCDRAAGARDLEE